MGFNPVFILYNIKMTKNVTINNVNYEVKNFEIPMWLKSFYSLYDRPSNEKVEIYEEWTGILNEIYGCTGSKFTFTIYWNVIDENWVIHDVRISKCHNYIK